MEKTLELIFTKSDGAKKTLSIADPREGLTHPCRRQNGSRQDHSRQRTDQRRPGTDRIYRSPHQNSYY